MGELTHFNPKSKLPAEMASVFDADALAGDLIEGATGGGFQVISIRGSKWRVKSGGVEHPILNLDTEEPAPSIEVVLLKAKKEVSKIWYAKKYSEGDSEAPDCFSIDGVAPDPSSTNAQAPSCAACPHNQWGSRITEAGKKAKACADTRRMAVLLMANVPHEVDDEPMLLRVPAASLGDLATFGAKMAEKGYPYNAIITRIGFDMNAAYPKLTFKAVRPITTEEAELVTEKFHSDIAHNILNTAPEMGAQEPGDTNTEAAPAVDSTFEEEEAPPAKASKKKSGKKTGTKAAKPEPKPVQEAAPAVEADADLDAIIAELEGLD